jgi:hypothetical protein
MLAISLNRLQGASSLNTHILLVGEADVMRSKAFDLRPHALKANGKRAKSLIASIIIAVVGKLKLSAPRIHRLMS